MHPKHLPTCKRKASRWIRFCNNIHADVFSLPFTALACARGTSPFEGAAAVGLVTARVERPPADGVVPGLVLSGIRSAEVVADFLRAGIAGALTGLRLVVATVDRVLARVPETGCGGRREAC